MQNHFTYIDVSTMEKLMILLIEDDVNISYALKLYFENKAYKMLHAPTLKQAQSFLALSPELILLDVQLPDGDGFSFFQDFTLSEIAPVIFLTAKQTDDDILKGLSMGAYDYLPKPFKIPILEAKIVNILKRQSAKRLPHKQIGSLIIDEAHQEVLDKGVKLDLTPTEYTILTYFIAHKNITLTRKQLLENIWDCKAQFVNDNTLTVTIKRLREKLPSSVKISSVRGIGYRLEWSYE